MVIVVDGKDREIGDYICAAEKASPEIVNFMLSGRGQLCVSILPEVSKRLDLNPLVVQNDPLKTAFLTPVDIREAKTGITAKERSETIRRLSSTECSADDFVRPGHVYPLLAKQEKSFVALVTRKLLSTWHAWPAWLPQRLARSLTSRENVPHVIVWRVSLRKRSQNHRYRATDRSSPCE